MLSGRKRERLWPRNVFGPSVLPTGCSTPLGNGLFSVPTNVSPRSWLAVSGVDCENPVCTLPEMMNGTV